MRIVSPQEIALLLKEDSRYQAEAYHFVCEALDFTVKTLNKPARGPDRHVTGSELLQGIRKYALQEYGPMAKTILQTWGIHNCQDFGAIVFNLVNRQIFGKTDQDSPDDFKAGFDFDAAFRAPFELEKSC